MLSALSTAVTLFTSSYNVTTKGLLYRSLGTQTNHKQWKVGQFNNLSMRVCSVIIITIINLGLSASWSPMLLQLPYLVHLVLSWSCAEWLSSRLALRQSMMSTHSRCGSPHSLFPSIIPNNLTFQLSLIVNCVWRINNYNWPLKFCIMTPATKTPNIAAKVLE